MAELPELVLKIDRLIQKIDKSLAVKVTYWNGRGLCEPIRMLLAAANVKFADQHFTANNGAQMFAELKESGKLLYKQAPLVEMDGLNLVQSGASFRYIANKYGLYGDNIKDKYLIDAVFEGVRDVRRFLTAYPFNQDKQIITDKLNSVIKERYFGIWDQLLSQSKSEYFLTNTSAADVVVFEMMDFIAEIYGENVLLDDILKGYDNMVKLYKKMKTFGGIDGYIKGRKHDNCDDYKNAVNKTLGR